MTREDRIFYRRRLQEERNRARTTLDPGLRHLHSQWALLYERRLADVHHAGGEPIGIAG